MSIDLQRLAEQARTAATYDDWHALARTIIAAAEADRGTGGGLAEPQTEAGRAVAAGERRSDVAKDFGITVDNVHRIVLRYSWRHVA